LSMTLIGRAEKSWKSANAIVNRKRICKVFAGLLIVIAASAVVYSAADAERWIVGESVYIPLPQATHYVATRINASDELMILCPINNLNINVLKFYLAANEGKNTTVVQYPTLPPDSFNMDFNASEAAQLCRENNVKYVLLDENTGYRYFNSSLTAPTVADLMVSSGNFTLAATFGSAPFRIFVFQTVPT
jgi:hypothetical protein